MSVNPEIAELDAKIAEFVKTSKLIAYTEHQAVVESLAVTTAEVAALTAKITELEEAKKTLSSALAEKDAALEEINSKELSSVRLAELDAILPYTEEEKKAETHVEYVKSLASLDNSSFEIAKLKRENQALKKSTSATQKSLASASRFPTTNPVPIPEGTEVISWSVENSPF